MNYELVKEKFDAYFRPKKNVEFERYKFLNLMQGDYSLPEFIAAVKRGSRGWEFNEMQESMVKTKLIHGINSDDLRKKLLSREDITLAKLEEMCFTYIPVGREVPHAPHF